MHRCDDEVELGEAVVSEIHRAVRTDVAFDSRQQRNALESIADLADALGVRDRAVFVEAVGHRQRFAVVGDRQVAEAGVAGSNRHRFDIFAAVGFGRVRMDISADVGERNQIGKGAPLGCLDFAAPFSQLGRNLRKAERS